jgi:hypothetical protein
MDALTSAFDVFAGINWTAIFQLTSVGLIAIAGPIVILLLALRGGDL